MIKVEKVFLGQEEPLSVRISFSLDGPGWNILQESDCWKELERYLEDLQREHKAADLQVLGYFPGVQ